jgi:ABC-2 type transport system permease protein
MRAFLALVRNDIALFASDRRALIMAFLAPMLIGSFFAYVFGGTGSSRPPGRVRVLVVDQDRGPVSTKVIDQLREDKSLDLVPSELEPARDAVRRGKASVALVFPPDFGEGAVRSLFNGGEGKPKVDVLVDPSHQTEAGMVKGILTGAVMRAVSQEAFTGSLGRKSVASARESLKGDTGLPPKERDSLLNLLDSVERFNATTTPGGAGPAAGMGVPFDTAEEQLTARSGVVYNAAAHSFAGMAVQFMLFMGIDVGIGLLTLRQRGLWRRYRAAPLSKLTLLGSRVTSATLIGMVILAAVLAFARLTFGVRVEGSVAGLVLVAVAFAFMTAAYGLLTAAYGLLIAALGRTPEAARGLSILATLLLVMLSGAWVPSFVFPAWLQSATKLLPTRWAMDGFDAMLWRGLPFADALFPAGALFLAAAACAAMAVLRFRWED